MIKEFEIFWSDLNPEKQKEISEYIDENTKDNLLPLCIFGIDNSCLEEE